MVEFMMRGRGAAKERLWANLTKGPSGIPGSGVPSDWSILTGIVNTRALMTQMRNAIWGGKCKMGLNGQHDFCRSPEKVLARFAERVSPVGDLAFVCSFGALSNFLSTIPENYLSTHQLKTENHKPAVMLLVLVGGL